MTAVLAPVGAQHDRVDGVHQEDLFVEGIGITGMAILVSAGFKERDGGEHPRHPCWDRDSKRHQAGFSQKAILSGRLLQGEMNGR